ncbi:enoyl-CoA hydratase/isomerase family protein [Piscinibacter sp. XHJ-5]|uniref:enoyl-CoA hydratase/isomerase family protein n=1 Tax=Piscinibacter sp. XHJ-5 TaxID=3037797 RepID=UPI002452D488|nr:enoyl-CoA hydratase/isomerase family protein [Piscinibacter sp. XHJ-5]
MFELNLRGRVAEVTMCRPPVNAISEEWGVAFTELLDGLDARDDWSVLHLRSSQKVFAAGADLAQIQSWITAERPDATLSSYIGKLQAVYRRLESLSRVTLAEIGGAALGGGLELALCCDLRVAADEIKVGLPEVGIGLIPGLGGTQRLTRLVGRGTAARLVLSAEPVDGASACALGIVQWSVPRERLAAEAARIADRIAGLPLPALKVAKELIGAHGAGHDAGYTLERELGGRLLLTPEAQQRITAFIQRRSS